MVPDQFCELQFFMIFMIFEKRDRVPIDPVKLEKPHENHIKLWALPLVEGGGAKHSPPDDAGEKIW